MYPYLLRRHWVKILITLPLFVLFFGCSSQPKKEQEMSHNDMSQNPQESKKSKETNMSHLDPSNHWSYVGATGPQFWGNLNPEYQLCKSGANQSPIDLKWKKPAQNRPLEINYHSTPLKIIDNGHTVQVNVESGNFIKINGMEYELKQVHFHSQSEHSLSGHHYPMEMHMVNQSKEGKIAVLARMIDLGSQPDPFIEKIWSHIPKEKEKEMTIIDQNLDLAMAIPKEKTYYNYTGSLTSPPCTEGVDWNVLNTPLKVSQDQLLAFQKLYTNNNRPVQQMNNRKPANY